MFGAYGAATCPTELQAATQALMVLNTGVKNWSIEGVRLD